MLSFTINDLLAQARKIGASDLHVAAGAEAKCRVHGELIHIKRGPVVCGRHCGIDHADGAGTTACIAG